MGIKGWARLLAEEGFTVDQPRNSGAAAAASAAPCCRGSLWRDPGLAEPLHVEAVPPHSTLHIDGNGLAFYLHQVAYARQIDRALRDGHRRRSRTVCAVPQDVAVGGAHEFLPNFMPLGLLEEVTREYIEALQRHKMRVILYWDGDARHVYKRATDQKRDENRVRERSNLHQYCLYGQLPASETVCKWEYEFPKSGLFKTQIIHTLTRLGVEMVDCPEEADPFMARIASGDASSFVLGNDTDFCAFKDIQYIPFSTIHASDRGPLSATVIRRRELADALGLHDSAMVELAIVCGNDYVIDPSAIGLPFYSRSIEDNIAFLQDVEPGYHLTTTRNEMEPVLAFVRASYNLEPLDDFPLDNGEDEEDLGSVLENVLDITMDHEEDSNMVVDIDVSLLAVQPAVDRTILDAVKRCIQRYVDVNSHLEINHTIFEPIHVEALQKLKLHDDTNVIPTTWRPVWKDVLAVKGIEKCLDLSFEMNMKSPIASLNSPRTIFDQLRFHMILYELRNENFAVLPESNSPKPPAECSAPAKSNVPLKLPIDEHEDSILDMISNNRISVIQGETGCGKSSRIPTMLLKSRRHSYNSGQVKLFISQPRRIAAKALVERLRDTEPDLSDLIALRMGHGHREYESNSTRAWFVTTGYLVRLLANNPGRFDDVTHLIIDEVHERSVDTDILCLLCRRLLVTNSKIRLVLMSATLAATLYQEYFDIQHPPLKVGARRFPVEEVFLDDLPTLFDLPKTVKNAVKTLMEGCGSMKCRISPNAQFMEKLHLVACHLAMVVGQPGTSVLIFVPGMMDIVSINERIEQLFVQGRRFTCFPIHSDIPFEDQMSVFRPAESDEVKIIVATNAAESSVTLPDVDNVICLGLCKQILYDEASHRQILMPTWISRASATQRAGRTGRVREGTCYRLYSRQNFNEHMEDFEPGEILRTPLDSVILSLKEVLHDEDVTDVLQNCIEPPNISAIERSLDSLFDSHFITEPSGVCDITRLGAFVSALGVDLALGSLIGLGIQFGVAAEVIQLAGILSFPKPPWIMSNPLIHDAQNFNEMTKRTYISRCHFDANLYSEPLAAMNLLFEFEAIKHDARKTYNFCQKHGLVIARLRRLLNTCHNLRVRVATFFDLGEEVLRIKEPPSHMPHAQITMLRVLQTWVFCDSMIVCQAKPKLLAGVSSEGFALEFVGKSDTVTEEHLEQVISKERHPFTLSGFVEYEHNVRFQYTAGSLPSGQFEERFLSYASEETISIVWLHDKDYLAVYVLDSLYSSSAFGDLVGRLNERLEKSAVLLGPNQHRRGVGERPCGLWKIKPFTEDIIDSGDEHVVYHRFLSRLANIPKSKLANMKKYHLKEYLKTNTSTKGLECDFSKSNGKCKLVSCGMVNAISDQDVRDLFSDSTASILKVQQRATTQTITFHASSNSPLTKPSPSLTGRTSWDRPMIESIPEGVRLLSVLASSRRKEHLLTLQPTTENGDEDSRPLKIHLQQAKTKVLGRWKQLATYQDVYVSENSVPATAVSNNLVDLFCVASNTLQIKGGGLKVEGLTLLPPGGLFLSLARLSFGLGVPGDILDSVDLKWVDRLQMAEEFYSSTEDLGEKLECFPDLIRQLCAIFDGVDGFEGQMWDIDANPFVPANSKKADLVVGETRRSSVGSSRYQTPGTILKKSNPPSNDAKTDYVECPVGLSKKKKRIRKKKNLPINGKNDLEASQLTSAEGKVSSVGVAPEALKSSAQTRISASVNGRDADAVVLVELKKFKGELPEATMLRLFSIDLIQSPEVSGTEPPSSNILALILNTYCQSNGEDQEEGRIDLLNKKQWSLRTTEINGRKYHLARFHYHAISYPSHTKKERKQLPAWFYADGSQRPTTVQTALRCLPPVFRDACAGCVREVAVDAHRLLVFDSCEMAVRFEASFWLQRQFLDGSAMSWYEQDLSVLVSKVLSRKSKQLNQKA